MKPITRTTRLHVLPEDQPLFSELATEVEINDEAGGEFVVVRQTYGKNGENEIRVDPEEWPEIKAAIDRMIAECRKDEAEESR